jgi:hypothetical protein
MAEARGAAGAAGAQQAGAGAGTRPGAGAQAARPPAAMVRDRGAAVCFSERRHCFVDRATKARYRGLGRRLALLCTQPSTLRYPAASPHSNTPCSKKRRSVKNQRSFGKAGGRRVDAAVTKAVQMASPSERAPFSSRSPDARRVLAALHAAQITPVYAQYVVWHQTARIATAIDIVGRDERTSEWVVLEVKCGYQGNFAAARGGVQGTGLDNSPTVLAGLQACAGADMMARSRQRRAGRIVVVHVTRDEVRLADVPVEVAQAMPAVLAAVYATVDTRAAARLKRPARAPRTKKESA